METELSENALQTEEPVYAKTMIGVTKIMIFPYPSFSRTQIKMTGDCSVFKSLRGSYNLEGKHLMRFLMIRSETSIFKFLRHSVNGALRT